MSLNGFNIQPFRVLKSHFGLEYGQPWSMAKILVEWLSNTACWKILKIPGNFSDVRKLKPPWRTRKFPSPCLIIYTWRAHHQECIFHMRMRPQKRALFEHKPTDSQTHSPLPNCEETNCNGLWLRRHVARRQARGAEPHVDKLQGDHATKLLLLKPVNNGSRPSHLWLRPSYAPQTCM